MNQANVNINNTLNNLILMCILFLALQQHPKYPVIICANRDEFHHRPTQKMHLWERPNILAGKDLQAGGTWLGLNSNGRFAALTNFRQPATFDTAKNSRGDLVLKALTNNSDDMARNLTATHEQYNGFNLVYGSLNNLHCFDSINKRHHQLSSGVHSICNGALDDLWPKMQLGQQQLTDVITKQNNSNFQPLNINQLFKIMTNDTQSLPENLPKTGVSDDWEQMLSSIFIVSEKYGTRSTVIVTCDLDDNVEVHEQNYNKYGKKIDQKKFKLAKQLND
jgi:uncharacterized protein with NRDE domain